MDGSLWVGVCACVLFSCEAVDASVFFVASEFFCWNNKIHFRRPLGCRLFVLVVAVLRNLYLFDLYFCTFGVRAPIFFILFLEHS